ncbi:MAG: efflux RND transporter periplasmic adaptor subunit [Deltaproteobacteria bacterium]|nr:efflux RND transporter periplasmic adaptor subunit [Deltaproteobacteria bacterium]
MIRILLYYNFAALVALGLLFSLPSLTSGAPQSETSTSPVRQAQPKSTDRNHQSPSAAAEDQADELAAVIAPHRSAEISAEARGVIESFHPKEGDFVEKDRVVVVISSERHVLALQRAKNALKAAEADLKRAKQETQLKEQLLAEKATTVAEALKGKAEEELAEYRLEEAKTGLTLARMDVESCQVKAPFSGHIAVRLKEPFEAVDYFQKLFVLVDTSKVYAIAGVSESALPDFTRNRRVAFVTSPGKERRFAGVVERVGKLFDPKSGTKKVYVLIDNPDGQLEVGMTGYLELAK